MSTRSRFTASLVLALICAAARSDPQFDASLAGFADNQDSRSLDLDASYSPNTRWTLGAGVGNAKSPAEQAGIDATSLRALVEAHSDRGGIRGYYRNYSDSNNFDLNTLGARAFLRRGGGTFSLIGESRDFSVDYTTGTLLNSTRGKADFTGSGFGAGASYSAAGWSGYLEGVFYDYGSQLDRFVSTTGNPGLLHVPLVRRLSRSFVTLNQGALDRQIGAGVERTFDRSALRFDWMGIEDAISSEKSNSLSAGYRYQLTPKANVGITLGVTDADSGSVNFGGLTFGLSH